MVRPFAKLTLSYKNAGLWFARFTDRGLGHYGGQVITSDDYGFLTSLWRAIGITFGQRLRGVFWH